MTIVITTSHINAIRRLGRRGALLATPDGLRVRSLTDAEYRAGKSVLPRGVVLLVGADVAYALTIRDSADWVSSYLSAIYAEDGVADYETARERFKDGRFRQDWSGSAAMTLRPRPETFEDWDS